jgi:sortase A
VSKSLKSGGCAARPGKLKLDKSEQSQPNQKPGQPQAEPLPDLAKLSLAEMEALIARKRLEESRQVLRKVRAKTAPSQERLETEEVSPASPITPTQEVPVVARPVASPPKPARPVNTSRFQPAPKAVAPEQRFRPVGLEVGKAGREKRSRGANGSDRVRNTLGYLLEGLVVTAIVLVCGNWLLLQFGISLNPFESGSLNNPPLLAPARAEGPLLNAVAAGAIPITPVATATPRPSVASPSSGSTTTSPIVAASPTPERVSPVTGQGEAVVAPTPTPVVVQARPAANVVAPVVQDDASNLVARRVVIPRIGVDSIIKEVTVDLGTWQVADFAVGHHLGTANPGQVGNMVLAGHRDIRGSVFLRLNELRKGDEIKVFTDSSVYRYVVTEIVEVAPTETSVMNPTVEPSATLITCTPIGYATRRLVVRAQLQQS